MAKPATTVVGASDVGRRVRTQPVVSEKTRIGAKPAGVASKHLPGCSATRANASLDSRRPPAVAPAAVSATVLVERPRSRLASTSRSPAATPASSRAATALVRIGAVMAAM